MDRSGSALQQFHGHADGMGEILPQWAGCRFDPRRVAVFRMTRGLASPLEEILDLFEVQAITRQVQQIIEEH